MRKPKKISGVWTDPEESLKIRASHSFFVIESRVPQTAGAIQVRCKVLALILHLSFGKYIFSKSGEYEFIDFGLTVSRRYLN